jgi:hypothetical protein
MKLCPHCEFIYEDDQSFCDMDGKELVYNPGPLAFEKNAPSAFAQLQHSAATPVILTPGPAPIRTSGLPSSFPSRWRQSRSYAVAAVTGVLLAMLLFMVYYARAHRSRSDNANQSPDQSYEQSTSRAPDTTSVVSPPATLAGSASTEQSPTQGGMVTLLKRSRVRAIQPLATPHRSQQPTGKRETSIAQNQPRAGKSEITTAKKESKVSSFLKKTGRILSKPFKF